MPNLRDATKARVGRKATKRVAGSSEKKVPKSPKNQPPVQSGSNLTPSPTITPTKGKAHASVDVPGLPSLAPGQIAAQMPQFSPESYQITDPLNPPTSIPQVSQTDYDQREGIYQGGIRALKLTGLGFDLTREKFTTIGKQVKAFGAGIKTATAIEAVKGDYFDYQSQVETTSQKSIALGVSQHKTTTDETRSTYSQQEMDEKLEQARIAAEPSMESAFTRKRL